MKIVIALGGNALADAKKKGEKFEDQLKKIQETSENLVELVKMGHTVVITHGNGPQVGSLLLQQQAKIEGATSLPLRILGALSQGQIGVLLQHSLINDLRKNGMDKDVFVIPTTVLVNRNDPGFENPTKPIGPFYSYEEYLLLKGKYTYTQKGSGYRRVVPSPQPLEILEASLIKQLMDENKLVIAVGGGGTPTIDDGQLKIVDAVIDKDLATAVLARTINADMLIIVTNIDGVYTDFGTEDQKLVNRLDITTAKELLEKNIKAMSGSMGPKIKACMDFIETGKTAIITSTDKIIEAMEGITGTTFEN